MILDKLQNAARYETLSPGFAAAFRYLLTNDLSALPAGRYPIDGDEVYLMIQEKPLIPWDECVWEAHRVYADVQLVLRGEELLGARDAVGLGVSEAYDPARDVMFYEQNAPGLSISMDDGDFAVFFPGEVHRPCARRAAPGAKTQTRRAVVKVRM